MILSQLIIFLRTSPNPFKAIKLEWHNFGINFKLCQMLDLFYKGTYFISL